MTAEQKEERESQKVSQDLQVTWKNMVETGGSSQERSRVLSGVQGGIGGSFVELQREQWLAQHRSRVEAAELGGVIPWLQVGTWVEVLDSQVCTLEWQNHS